jgi:hypothetical protein
MLQWLRDALGVKRYAVAWNFKATSGCVLSGNDVQYGRGPHKRRTAQWIANEMCKTYGDNTHWIEAV